MTAPSKRRPRARASSERPAAADASTGTRVDDAARPRDEPLRPSYKIGAVARLTGISTHRIRKWETRYAMVHPHRTEGGDRLYSSDEVRRLMLAKSLVEAGMAIAEVAGMSTERIALGHQELVGHRSIAMDGGQARIRTAVAGPSLPQSIQPGHENLDRIDVAVAGATAKELLELGQIPPVDLVIWECPTLQPSDKTRLDALISHTGASGAIVVFGFGARATVSEMRAPGVALIASPVDPTELQRLAIGLLAETRGGAKPAPAQTALTVPVSRPRYSLDTLIRVSKASPTLACECPTHASELIMRLHAFEEYTNDCENASDGDAALHRFLHSTAGRARMLFEDALERLAEAEGILLD